MPNLLSKVANGSKSDNRKWSDNFRCGKTIKFRRKWYNMITYWSCEKGRNSVSHTHDTKPQKLVKKFRKLRRSAKFKDNKLIMKLQEIND